MFAHGFNIHFGQIVPPAECDVYHGCTKRTWTLSKKNIYRRRWRSSIFAIYQDVTGKAKDIALAYAKGIGSLRAGVIETTFKEETETDLFGEQAVLCGGTTALIKAGFETLLKLATNQKLLTSNVYTKLN